MSFNVRDLIDAGRGHLIPDQEYADALAEWEPTDWAEVDSEAAQEAQEEAEHGAWDA